MKKNIKTIIIIVILLLAGILAAVGVQTARTYLGGAIGGKEPTNVRVEADIKSATVTWQTEQEVQGTIEYGTTPASLMLRAPETQPVTSHRVVLSPLRADTTYYFRIRVGDDIFDNNGIPFSFKTKPEEVIPEQPLPVDEEPEVPIEEPEAPEEELEYSPEEPETPEEPEDTPEEPDLEEKVSYCDIDEFKGKFGTSDSRYDFDDNGIVNTRDWLLCLEENE